jgi:hypothetical protein
MRRYKHWCFVEDRRKKSENEMIDDRCRCVRDVRGAFDLAQHVRKDKSGCVALAYCTASSRSAAVGIRGNSHPPPNLRDVIVILTRYRRYK